jgi:hypothetical protein
VTGHPDRSLKALQMRPHNGTNSNLGISRRYFLAKRFEFAFGVSRTEKKGSDVDQYICRIGLRLTSFQKQSLQLLSSLFLARGKIYLDGKAADVTLLS